MRRGGARPRPARQKNKPSHQMGKTKIKAATEADEAIAGARIVRKDRLTIT